MHTFLIVFTATIFIIWIFAIMNCSPCICLPFHFKTDTRITPLLRGFLRKSQRFCNSSQTSVWSGPLIATLPCFASIESSSHIGLLCVAQTCPVLTLLGPCPRYLHGSPPHSLPVFAPVTLSHRGFPWPPHWKFSTCSSFRVPYLPLLFCFSHSTHCFTVNDIMYHLPYFLSLPVSSMRKGLGSVLLTAVSPGVGTQYLLNEMPGSRVIWFQHSSKLILQPKIIWNFCCALKKH